MQLDIYTPGELPFGQKLSPGPKYGELFVHYVFKGDHGYCKQTNLRTKTEKDLLGVKTIKIALP